MSFRTGCGSCSEEFGDREESVPCSGMCNKSYHLNCASVSKTVYNILLKSPHIRFYCKPCSQLNFMEVINRIDKLTECMTQLMSEFSTLAKLMTTSISTAALQPLHGIHSEISTSRNESILRSGNSGDSIIGTSISTSLKSVPITNNKQLYVGRLNPTTTAGDITEFVASNLGINSEEVHCRPLFSKNCDFSRMTFVSFKVVVPNDRYDELLNASLWPAGVEVHPFVQRERRIRTMHPGPGPATSFPALPVVISNEPIPSTSRSIQHSKNE